MGKILKIIFKIAGIVLLILLIILTYLNFILLPQKVKSLGPGYLQQRSGGRIQAESIQYIPFKGLKLENIAVLSEARQPILKIDRLQLNVKLWPLISRRELCFGLNLYPEGLSSPVRLLGRFQKQTLDVDLKTENPWFKVRQDILGKIKVVTDDEKKITINLEITSADLNMQGELSVKDSDLEIKQLKGRLLGSAFEFIGDVQDLSSPNLNIYGNLDLNLSGLEGLSLPQSKALNELGLSGRSTAEVYISSSINNPEIGLKLSGQEIKIKKIKLDGLTLSAKLQDKTLALSKCYLTLYGGELNLEGGCNFNSPDFPANLNANMFNLGLNELIRDLSGKDTPVHGRVFGLTRLDGPLKNIQAVEGKLWLSASGSNILQLPLFAPIAEVLRMPELRQTEFKEASGNFQVANQALKTDDFKIISNNIVIYFQGYMDFQGNLGLDVRPSFTEAFLTASPNLGNVLGIFFDSTGNFLGEIKMKGSLNEPRVTYKPLAVDKFIPRGIEQGIKQFFKFKNKED